MAWLRAGDFALLWALCLPRVSATPAQVLNRQSTPNNQISSGTCYFGPNEEADPSYIPCGNTAFGNFACCEATADCLDENACFADGTTYVAGCTDPTYQDATCPNKGPYSDEQWASLVYCNGTSDEWTLCDHSQSTSSNQVVYVSGCYCPDDDSARNVAFDAGSTLAAHVSLPAGIGGTMSLFAGYTLGTVLASTSSSIPTTTSTTPPPKTTSTTPHATSSTPPTTVTHSSTTTTTSTTPSSSTTTTTSSSSSISSSSQSTSSTTSSSSTTTSSSSSSSSVSPPTSSTTPVIPPTSSTSSSNPATSTPTSSAESISSSASSPSNTNFGAAQSTSSSSPVPATGGLSTGAKAGIGVGAALGGLGLLALIGFLAFWFGRRRRRAEDDGAARPRSDVQPMAKDDYNRYQQRSPAWSGGTSELAGDQRHSAQTTMTPESLQQSWSRPISTEVEGSIPTYQSMASSGSHSQELGDTGRGQGYQAYRRAEVPPVGVQGAPTSGSAYNASYRPGRQMGDGVYEMPAQLPGSTII